MISYRPADRGGQLITIIFVPLFIALVFSINIQSARADGRRIGLQDALTLVLQQNPGIQVQQHRIARYAGQVSDAGRLENPALELEIEEALGSGDLAGFESAQFTVSLQQKIPLSRRRSNNKALAVQRLSVAELRRDVFLNDLKTRAKIAFIEVLAAREQAATASQLVDLAHESLEAIRQRQRAGASNDVDLARAEIVLAKAKIAAAKRQNDYQSALGRLCGLWGQVTTDISGVSGLLGELAAAPPGSVTNDQVQSSPSVLLAEAEVKQALANKALTFSSTVPDIGIRAGASYLNESGDTGLLAGVSVPIPVWNRKKGVRASASANLSAFEAQHRAELLRVGAEVKQLVNQAAGLQQESETITRQILPQAQSAYEAADKLFRRGRFTYLELLDAQRMLSDARVQQIRTLSDWLQTVAKLDGLLGTDLLAESSSGENK